MNLGLHKEQVSTYQHFEAPQTALADKETLNVWITYPTKQTWCKKKKKKPCIFSVDVKNVDSLEKQIKLYFRKKSIRGFMIECRTPSHQDRLLSLLLNFFSQIQAYLSVQSVRLWLFGILKILFVKQWTVSDSLFNILNTNSHIVNSVFLVSKSWVVACNIHVGWRLERFCLYMFLSILKHVLYLVNAAHVYPHSFFFSVEWVRSFNLHVIKHLSTLYTL